LSISSLDKRDSHLSDPYKSNSVYNSTASPFKTANQKTQDSSSSFLTPMSVPHEQHIQSSTNRLLAKYSLLKQ